MGCHGLVFAEKPTLRCSLRQKNFNCLMTFFKPHTWTKCFVKKNWVGTEPTFSKPEDEKGLSKFSLAGLSPESHNFGSHPVDFNWMTLVHCFVCSQVFLTRDKKSQKWKQSKVFEGVFLCSYSLLKEIAFSDQVPNIYMLQSHECAAVYISVSFCDVSCRIYSLTPIIINIITMMCIQRAKSE